MSASAERNQMSGFVVPAYDQWEEDEELTYADMVHRIRVGLAGRAAEHLVLGITQVTFSGSHTDLQRAHHRSLVDPFANNGHSPDLSSAAAAAANLTILPGHAVDAETRRIEGMCRRFLQAQYLGVLELLRNSATCSTGSRRP